jgi:hypothetical protein
LILKAIGCLEISRKTQKYFFLYYFDLKNTIITFETKKTTDLYSFIIILVLFVRKSRDKFISKLVPENRNNIYETDSI